jgi:hypothetical protein
MATKKISDLTAKTTELQKLDLLNVSEWNGATYDTKSIDGEKFILSTKVSLSAAQIKTANSVPVSLIAAPGAGKFIEVISATYRFNWGTIAFDAGTYKISLKINGASQSQFEKDNVTFITTNNFAQFEQVASTAISLIDNASLTFTTSNDSTVGDSTIDLYINYRIITL